MKAQRLKIFPLITQPDSVLYGPSYVTFMSIGSVWC